MFNRINITGRLTTNPKKTGDKYAFFYIYLGSKGHMNIGVEVAGRTAALVLEKCSKGDVVSVDGTLTYKDIFEADTGRIYKNFYVQASTICFFDRSKQNDD